jgi:hypothetical protein
MRFSKEGQIAESREAEPYELLLSVADSQTKCNCCEGEYSTGVSKGQISLEEIGLYILL